MSQTKPNRREFAALIASSAAAVGLIGVSASEATAYQGNMERALSSLFEALASLREASSNKGGHRVHAMHLVEQAITEVQAGIEFADEHGWGGQQ
jgi:hypothetical protein